MIIFELIDSSNFPVRIGGFGVRYRNMYVEFFNQNQRSGHINLAPDRFLNYTFELVSRLNMHDSTKIFVLEETLSSKVRRSIFFVEILYKKICKKKVMINLGYRSVFFSPVFD